MSLKKRKLFILAAALALLPYNLLAYYSNDDPDSLCSPKNSGIIEVLGHSRSLISGNYERRVALRGKYLASFVRIGIGFTPGLTGPDNVKHKGVLSVPLAVSVHVGNKNHAAVFGAGYTSSFGENWTDSLTTPPTLHRKFESALILRVGYRYYDRSGAIFEGYPIFQWTDNPSSRFSLGIGLCIGFGR